LTKFHQFTLTLFISVKVKNLTSIYKRVLLFSVQKRTEQTFGNKRLLHQCR